MCDLILASGSSRRHSLLKHLHLEYRVYVPDVDEGVLVDELATEYVNRIAKLKVLTACEHVSDRQAILAADTIISLYGEIIGKPENTEHAKNILQKLSAVEHEVLTALCLKIKDHCYEKVVVTKIKFKQLTNNQINAYCSTDEPYDKAGAYAIQGFAASFIEYIHGSYTNVVGLPLFDLHNMFKQSNLYKYNDV